MKNVRQARERNVPTPEMVARHGHVAAAIRKYMEDEGIGPGEFSKRLGLPAKSTTIYGWLSCRAGPSNKMMLMLASVLNVKMEELLERRDVVVPSVSYRAQPPRRGRPPKDGADVLSFTVHTDGTATLSVRARMPVEPAMALMQSMLKAQLLYGKEEDDEE